MLRWLEGSGVPAVTLSHTLLAAPDILLLAAEPGPWWWVGAWHLLGHRAGR